MSEFEDTKVKLPNYIEVAKGELNEKILAVSTSCDEMAANLQGF